MLQNIHAARLVGHRRALVVEPNATIRPIIIDALASMDIEAESVDDARAALTHLTHNPTPDLVLMASQCRTVDGDDVIAKMRALPRLSGVPVLLVVDGRDPVRVPQLPLVDRIERPIRKQELVVRVEHLLEETEPLLRVSPAAGKQSTHIFVKPTAVKR